MEIVVSGSLDGALRILARKRLTCGIERELRVRRFPKRSERIRSQGRMQFLNLRDVT